MLSLRANCFRVVLSLTFVGAVWAEVDFQREVRPILSDNCFQCHGPDAETRLMDIRLDTREGAFAERPTGVLIKPGDPAASLVYQRVTHEDPARRMPPAHTHKQVSPEEAEILRRWIEEGAEWDEHWAFQNPVRPEPPSVERRDWPRNPIDAFVLKRIEAEGLSPAPEADRRTLIRRASLDLTGLPPAPADVEAFVSDQDPRAYERMVDRLLRSQAYGEHRARYWLDAARYADTHGLHIDNYREMWPYRDWVIEAFNENMPFDRFTVEQIAGDLLENPTHDQLVATGFHRCNVTTNEGGVIDEEVAAMYDLDRVDTTGAVWLGLTLGCAPCHDHKFDPVSQQDFYSMAAFFRNTTQKPRDDNIHDPPPVIFHPSPEQAERLEALERAEQEATIKILDARRRALARFSKRLQAPKAALAARSNPVEKAEIFSWNALRADEARTVGEVVVEEVPDAGGAALRFGEESYAETDRAPALTDRTPFTLSFRVKLDDDDGGGPVANQFAPGEDYFEHRGWSVDLSKGRPRIVFWGDRDLQWGARATGNDKVDPGSWRHVAVSNDGSGLRSGLRFYIDGRLVGSAEEGNAVRRLPGVGETGRPLRVGGREESAFKDGALADLRIHDRDLTPDEVRLLALRPEWEAARETPVGDLSGAEREALESAYLIGEDRDYAERMRELHARQAELRNFRETIPVTHVMHERMDSEPFAHILHRGMYDQPRERVSPATPRVLPPMPPDYPRNRLGLARWLVADENPLTARVTVNRFWQQVFGRGIVETAGDFGSQGTPPTHPELLDWLAVEFRESGWDVKHLFRLIVTSATYRQSAAATPEKIEKDPENRLLSRGPRFRMDAEMIRDYALAAAGVLNREVGGPSVKPYQPRGVWETVAMKNSNTRFYQRDDGDDLYRRTVYTFWKRSAPPPALDIFNAPTREHTTVRRERTNTPLQALVTMNDPQFVEAARLLAEAAMRTAKDFDRRVDFMTARVLARPLEAREREVVRAAHEGFIERYEAEPGQAARLIETGASEPDRGLPAAELAAWTMVANQLFNLDEALNK